MIDGKADLLCIHLGVCHVGAVRDERPAAARPHRDGSYLDRSGGVIDDGGIDCCVNCTVLRYRQREVRRNRDGETGHQITAVIAGSVTVFISVISVIITGIAAGTRLRSAMFGLRVGLPFTVSEAVFFICRGTVTADGTL